MISRFEAVLPCGTFTALTIGYGAACHIDPEVSAQQVGARHPRKRQAQACGGGLGGARVDGPGAVHSDRHAAAEITIVEVGWEESVERRRGRPLALLGGRAAPSAPRRLELHCC